MRALVILALLLAACTFAPVSYAGGDQICLPNAVGGGQTCFARQQICPDGKVVTYPVTCSAPAPAACTATKNSQCCNGTTIPPATYRSGMAAIKKFCTPQGGLPPNFSLPNAG